MALQPFDTAAALSDNPLADVLFNTRDDLAPTVTTLSIRFDSASEVTEYPVESGRSVADHTSARPIRITMTGLVTGDSLGGRAPREVDAEFRRLQDVGQQLRISTPRGTFQDCVITRLDSTLTAGNAKALEFSVEFTQVRLADIETVDTLPIFDGDYARDLAFNEYLALSQPGLDETSDVMTDTDADVVRVQTRILNLDGEQFVRDQFEQLRNQGIDENTLSYIKSQDYARAILDFSTPLFNAQQLINPQLVVGGNTFEIDLLDVDTIEQQQQVRFRTPSGRPAKFTVETNLRDVDGGVFTLRLRFRYEYALTIGGSYNPTDPDRIFGRSPLSQGRWYMGYSAFRRVFLGFANPASRVGGENIRLEPGVPIKLGDGLDFGMIMPLPRFGGDDADSEILLYRAFVGINDSLPSFMMLHINNPNAFAAQLTGDDAVRRLRLALELEE